VIGNPDAEYEIVKVCNPYCGPCAKAHPELDALIHSNPNIKVRIIFTATGEENDRRTLPVQHLLAIQERDGREQVQKAVDNWYMAETRDYTAFSNKYPMDGELKKQRYKIEDMHRWCQQMKITVTPTFFINGFQLPDSYRIEELKHILKDTT
jgi:Protein-disulfide isomerase